MDSETISQPSQLKLNLLGEIQIEYNGRPLTSLTTRKGIGLLAVLAASGGQPVSRDNISSLLWPETVNQSARANLRQTLAILRKALRHNETPVVVSAGKGLQLVSDPTRLDISLFETLCVENSTESLTRAVSLYRGEFLQGFRLDESEFDEWLSIRQRHFKELYLSSLKTLTVRYWEYGEHYKSIEAGQKFLDIEPLQEDIYRTLMQVCSEAGYRSKTVSLYRDCCNTLDRELKVTPEHSTTVLYRRLVRRSARNQPKESYDRHSDTVSPPTPTVREPVHSVYLRQELMSNFLKIKKPTWVHLPRFNCASAITSVALILLTTALVFFTQFDSRKSQLLAQLVAGDQQGILNFLESGRDINSAGEHNAPPLFRAVKSRNIELVSLLIGLGADANGKAQRGNMTPLHQAAANGDALIINLLIANGANPNERDFKQQPPLFQAARGGHLAAIEALLEGGASVDRRERVTGKTALLVAIAAGQVEAANALLKWGADINIFAPRLSADGAAFLMATSEYSLHAMQGTELVSWVAENGGKGASEILLHHIHRGGPAAASKEKYQKLYEAMISELQRIVSKTSA